MIAKKRFSLFLFFILQCCNEVYSDRQIASIMDCIKLFERQPLFEVQQRAIQSHRATYVIRELEFERKKNLSLLPQESSDHYPYHLYKNAVSKTIYSVVHEPNPSIMVITKNCSTWQTRAILQHIESLNYNTYCTSFDIATFDHIDLFTDINVLHVKIVVLLLPRLFIQIILEMVADHHGESFRYVTLEYIADLIAHAQKINPFLKFIDLKLVRSMEVLQGSMNGSRKSFNHTVCSLTPTNVLDHVPSTESTRMRQQDQYHVTGCQYRPQKVIRVVTLLFLDYVFPVPNILPYKNKCEQGIPCKVPQKRNETTKETRWEWICCTGSLVDILVLVMRDISNPFILYIAEDGKFGAKKNGIWNGLVGDVYKDKADIAIQGLSLTEARFQAVDYMNRWLERQVFVGVIMKNREENLSFFSWTFLPVEGHVLIGIVVAIHLFVLFVVYLFEFVAHRIVEKQEKKFTLRESWSFVGAILFQRDLGGMVVRDRGARVVAISYAFVMTFLISTYTASLTAENIDYGKTPNFNGLRDKKFFTSSYRVGVLRSSRNEMLMDRYGHTCKRVYIKSYADGAERILNGTVDAIIGTTLSLERTIEANDAFCKSLSLFADPGESDPLAWAYQKNSKLGEMLSLRILRLFEGQAIRNIVQKWSSISSCQGSSYHQYPWQYAGGLIICLLVTIGLCLIILVIEHMLSLWENKRKKNRPKAKVRHGKAATSRNTSHLE